MRSERDSEHIGSFYHLSREENAEHLCQGTACFVARQLTGPLVRSYASTPARILPGQLFRGASGKW